MMKQEDLFRKIGNILTELQEQYQYLAANPHELNELELELFLSNANFLTDHINIVIKAHHHHEQKSIAAPATEMPEVHHPEGNLDPDKEPEAFEFLLNEPVSGERTVQQGMPFQQEKPSEDKEVSHNKFDFEEKQVEEIFNRPLTPEEQRIIAHKQSLKSKEETNGNLNPTEEQGPEPFLVKPQPEFINEAPIKIEVLSVPETPLVTPTVPVTVTETPVVIPETPFVTPTVPVTVTEEPVVIPETPVVTPTVPLTITEIPVVFSETPGVPETPVAPEKPFVAPVTTAANAEAPVKLTLNERLAGNFNGSRTTEAPVAEIKDLKQSISLNDKLLFVKDLFHGYSLAYAEVIELVNKMPDYKTADAFLQKNYAQKNDWQSKQSTVDRFYDLLKRRFPTK